MRLSVVVASVLLVVAAACGGSSKPTAPVAQSPEPPPPVAEASPPAAADSPAALNDGQGPTAAEALQYVLDAIRAGEGDKAKVETWFSSEFLAQVSADEVAQAVVALHQQLGKFEVKDQGGTPPQEATAVLHGASLTLRVALTMSQNRPRQIAGLVFRPKSTIAPPGSYDGAVELLGKTGAKRQLLVASIEKDRCVPVYSHNSDERMPVASTSKLWVLLALDEKLRSDKKLSWDTKLPIRDESKSLPSGTMRDDPAGTEHTLREYATQMISISDNTATDHLIDFIGEAAVERALVLAKHGKPALNTPYLRTRELFGLKLAASPDELEVYRKGSVAAKRKFLAEVRKRPIDLEKAIKEWQAPRALDLEWFASGKELCNALAALATRAKFAPESDLLAALGKSVAVEVDRSQWRYVGFKGGSEPGVLHLSFLLQRADGKWFAVVLAVNDDARVLDEDVTLAAAAGAVSVLGSAATPATQPTR